MNLTAPYFPALRVFEPTPDIDIVEWADSERELSGESSHYRGAWKTDNAPHTRRIMEVLSPQHPCTRVVLMKCTQSAGTETAVNLIGHRRRHDPTSILVVLPTTGSAENWSKSRLTELFEKSFPDEKPRGSDTIFHKDFLGGSVKFASAESPASLKSNPIEVAIMDELDEFPLTVGTQGCPIALVDARQSTYPFKKMFLLSSPTDEETSRIWREFQDSNQQHLYVPCLHCDAQQTIDWENIKYENNDPESARWECKYCGELHEDTDKEKFLHRGDWIAHNPGHPTEGFHLPAFYLPWFPWSKCVEIWLKAQKDKNLLPTFTNTIRGLPSKVKAIEAPPAEDLYDRTEDSYRKAFVPEGPCVLTAGVDVQGDRLEMEVIGWAPGLESWSIDYQVIPGSPFDLKTWDALASAISETYLTFDGLQMGISKVGIDTGFETTEVKGFLRRYSGLGSVVGVRGQSSETYMDIIKLQSNLEPGMVIWNVGTGVLKSQIYGFLSLEGEEDEDGTLIYPPGYCHFPAEYGIEYFEMLTVERQVRNPRTGRYGFRNSKDERNESLDTRVYARAALESLGIARWQEHHWEAQRAKAKPIVDRQTRQEQKAANPKKSLRPKINPQDDFW